MVAGTLIVLSLKCQFLHKEGIRSIKLRELKGGTTWDMEIQSQISVLTFVGCRHVLDSRDMERSE